MSDDSSRVRRSALDVGLSVGPIWCLENMLYDDPPALGCKVAKGTRLEALLVNVELGAGMMYALWSDRAPAVAID